MRGPWRGSPGTLSEGCQAVGLGSLTQRAQALDQAFDRVEVREVGGTIPGNPPGEVGRQGLADELDGVAEVPPGEAGIA